MTRAEQCKSCAWHSKIGGYEHAVSACIYADSIRPFGAPSPRGEGKNTARGG